MMKQTTPSPCKESGGSCDMLRNNQLRSDIAKARQDMAMSEPSSHKDVVHFHPSAMPFSHLLQGDGFGKHRHGGLDHSSSSYMRQLSGMEIEDALRIPNSHGGPSVISPEGLLGAILSTQQKLQQLHAVVELVVRAGGQGQEHQSITAGVISIISQLIAATACLQQQPPTLSSGFSLSNDGLKFDGFYDNGMSNSASAGRLELMNSSLKLAGIRKPFAVNDSELQSQAMEPFLMNGEQIEPRFKHQASNALFDDPPGSLSHSNTSTKLVDFGISSESLACNSKVANRNQEAEDQEFINVSREDEDDDGEAENLPPGSYELVEMAATEILAEHAHFCEICGKGFKRDANLRMHMRGHGDEYKTPAALARPEKSQGCLAVVKTRRYSCPFVGCKRNKQHKKFLPLKSTLCVKNHYRRSHCPKLLTCRKCKVKKFSVVADLKTHEKHCGQDKWQCSCGTTFSRKDKLTGHVNLFTGHYPMVSPHETDNQNSHEPQ